MNKKYFLLIILSLTQHYITCSSQILKQPNYAQQTIARNRMFFYNPRGINCHVSINNISTQHRLESLQNKGYQWENNVEDTYSNTQHPNHESFLAHSYRCMIQAETGKRIYVPRQLHENGTW